MKTIVISGINLFEGGPLSIYKDCLESIVQSQLDETNNIIAFIHNKELFSEINTGKIKLVEIPESRVSYLNRLWYEYIYFYLFSRKKVVDVWLSLHDITPNVKAKRRYVYCHNPSPFLSMDLKKVKYGYKYFLFSKLYKYLYRINIKKNNAVIVQQDWLRTEFKALYNLTNVIVAKPAINADENLKNGISKVEQERYCFIYPAFPRFFKNFEAICESCRLLEKKGINNFQVMITINGTENKYSMDLKKEYGSLQTINFIGLQDRINLYSLYRKVDCMIFPSKLETWGLPISEFKQTGKPMLIADLPYAYETVGTYDKAAFFNPSKPADLAILMEKLIMDELVFKGVKEKCVEEPYAENWQALLNMIIK